MSMNVTIVAFRPADDRWKQMKAIYDSCKKAGVSIPDEVNEFFNYEKPDDNGVEIDIKIATKEWSDDYSHGYDVDISKLPKDVSIIRFYNSW